MDFDLWRCYLIIRCPWNDNSTKLMELIRNKHLFSISHLKYGNVGGENGGFFIANKELSKGNVGKEDAINLWQWWGQVTMLGPRSSQEQQRNFGLARSLWKAAIRGLFVGTRMSCMSGFSSWMLWQNHLREGFVVKINLSDSQWSENTINTHKYNTIYWSSSRSYYNLSSHINCTEDVQSQNYASKDKSEFAEAFSLNAQDILFALKENVVHRRSKPEDPSTEPNPHRFGLPTDNPHRHRRQEEAAPHLHTKSQQEQSLSDYAQQDLSEMTKRPPLNMQRL
jgi:hypothetical protein